MTEQKPFLTAQVIAHNEEKNLPDCLAALAFADELVVVLDRCTDGSRDIALAHGARLVEGAWPLEGARRAAGQDACNGAWILEVDADERISPALAEEVRAVLRRVDDKTTYFRIPFDNYIGARLVRYGWGAHYGVTARACLFRKGVKRWGDQRVHPKVEIQGRAGTTLQNRVAHFVDADVCEMIDRLDRYTSARALDLIDSGEIGTLRKNVARIFGRFYKCFVLRKGYKEGALGVTIALFAGLYPFLSYVKAQEIREKSRAA